MRAVARARPAFAALCREYPDGRVLVVAHQTLMRLMLCALLDIALDRYRTVFPRLDNVALTTVRVPGGLGGPPAGRAAVRAQVGPSRCRRWAAIRTGASTEPLPA